MNDIKMFKNDLFEVAVKLKNGDIVFDTELVAKCLGFTQIKNDKEYVRWETINKYLSKSFSQDVGKGDFIPEAAVYKLAFKASNEVAEKFQDWLAVEVLPSIRKHGAYMTDDIVDQFINDPDFGIRLLTQFKEERQKRKEVEKVNNILMHINKNYTCTEIAKEIGFKSAAALNNDLREKKIQYKQNETWVLYSKYADNGYVDIKQEVLDNGKVIYHRKFTQLGREFLLKLYGIDEYKAM
jgi:prophage antirepressor-like protein